jgi:HK97 gp10 family phage protein
MTGSVFGVAEVKAALDRIVAESTAASVRIVKRAEAVVEANAKKQFTGSHKRGEPTTSTPGSPPDVVTGTLRRSIVSDVPTLSGFVVTGRVYPTAVYARIQELGGQGLPPRPYMQPAYEASLDKLRDIAVQEWGKATH